MAEIVNNADEAARLFIEARRSGAPIGEFPELLQPRNLEEAYAIQDAVMAAEGAIGGWKVGEDAQGLISCAMVPARRIFPSGAVLKADEFRDGAVEVELAFLMGQDLPDRATSYGREEVAAAIAGFVPLVEVVGTRFNARAGIPSLLAHADSLFNEAFVIGKAISDWRGIDVTQGGITLRLNGTIRQTVERNSGRDPLRLVSWLANHAVKRRGGGLRAGQIVTTGSLAGATASEPGQVEAVYPGLGALHFTL